METRTKKHHRSRDDRPKGSCSYKKGVIHPKFYYIWTYWTSKYKKRSKALTEKSFYMKKICGIGYLSRYHAKHVAVKTCGVDVLKYIHIIKGSKLIKQGVTTLKVNRRLNCIDYKGKLVKLRRWIYPSEYSITRTRRSLFIMQNTVRWKKFGRKAFNRHYKKFFIGSRIGISKLTVSRNLWAVRAKLLEQDPDKVTKEDLEILAKNLENYRL